MVTTGRRSAGSGFVEVDHDQAAELVAEQFPQWSDRPLTRVEPGGSDHVIYRLGDELSARFPRHAGAVDQARHETRWLPGLAPQLPLPIPNRSLWVSQGTATPGVGRSIAGCLEHASDHKITAVVDFGSLGTGDPAIERATTRQILAAVEG